MKVGVLLSILPLVGCVAPTPVPTPPPSAAPVTVTAAPSPHSVAGDCIQPGDASSHVYHPDRLKVLNPCVTVTGTIASIAAEPDGDIHVRIRVDSTFEWTLNQANLNYQHGLLVAELVCEHAPTQTDAIPACSGYVNSLAIPPVGAHVSVEGAFVTDEDHGWNEIHPVVGLEVLP